ncbi:MAG: sugar nucleotide-binding protein [Pseudomonadota bacterium]
MKVLLLGADTTLGLALHAHLVHWGRHEVIPLGLTASRWKSERQAKKAVRRADCDVVVDLRIKAAADTGEIIGVADLERSKWLAKTCNRSGEIYVYLSSSRVFAGHASRLYTELDAPDNESTLGRLLQQAEQFVLNRCERHIVLRMGPTFSHRGVNILTHLLEQLLQNGHLHLDNQVRGCPVEASDAARVIAAVIDQLSTGVQPWGIFHYCSNDPTNWYEFGESLLASASQFSQFDDHAVELECPPAPPDVASRMLECSKIRDYFAIKQVPWRGFIGDSVKQYFEQQSAES